MQTDVSDEPLSATELRTQVVRGLRWTMIARPTVECVLLGSMVLLARLISPADFGRFAVALVARELTMVPAQGVCTSLVQRPTVTRQHLETGFALALLTGLVVAGLTFVAAEVIVTPIFGTRTAELVRLMIPVSLLSAVSLVPLSVVQRRLQFRRLSVLDVSSTSIRSSVAIALALVGLGAKSLVLSDIVATLSSVILLFLWAPPPLPRLHRVAAREISGYGLPAALAAISWVGFRNCDYAIVGARLGALRAGYYFRAYTLGVEYQKKVSLVMTSVGFPVLSRTQTGEDMNLLRSRMAGLLALVLFPLLALLAILAPVFLPWLFGSAWAPAVVPTQILAIGGAATLVIDTVGVALMAAGRPRALVGYGWAHFLAYGSAVFLVAPYGLTAVAIAASVVHSIFLPVAYVLMFRGSARRAVASLRSDITPAFVSSVVLAAVSIPLSIALLRVHVPVVPYLVLIATVGGAAYLATLRICFPDALRILRAVGRHLLPDGLPLRGLRRQLAVDDLGPVPEARGT